MKYLSFLLFLIAVLFIGCNDQDEDQNSVFIGGQIINPNTDFLILSQEGNPLDTLYLNDDNEFGKTINDLEAGIYTFTHPPENQIMYVEPGDSLLIWLNTLEFDESINFSGRGAEKSNFLLDMFLLNKEDNDLILSYYRINPNKFAKITDSIRDERLQKLESLNDKQEFSDDFLEIAHASIDYEFYDLRERYTYLIKKYFDLASEEIPDTFHDYRENIDFNNVNLQGYYVYMNFIDDYLRTKSIEHCETENISNRDCYDLNDFDNIRRRIIMIDSLSETPEIKNKFLTRLASQSMILTETESEIDSVLQVLNNTSFVGHENIRKLVDIQKNYLVGESMRDHELLNTDKEEITYKDLLGEPIITYAWSSYSPGHHKWQQTIIKELRQKYPEIKFIGINIDEGEVEDWLTLIETQSYNSDYEFQVLKRSLEPEIFKNYLSKILFLDKNGIIVKGDAQLNSPEFESDILEFLNNQ